MTTPIKPDAWATFDANCDTWTVHSCEGEAKSCAARWNKLRTCNDYGPKAPVTYGPLVSIATLRRAVREAVELAREMDTVGNVVIREKPTYEVDDIVDRVCGKAAP